MNNNPKIVVFSDLDGSLLNTKYESEEIEPILRRLLSLNVSIVLASSKTRAEIDYYRKKWQIIDPFIAENGSVIIVPSGYFKTPSEASASIQGDDVIELGTTYELVRERLARAKNQTGAEIVGFGDLTVEEIAKDTSLPPDLAALAKKREYSEPFKILSGDEGQVLHAIEQAGLCYTKGGRYLTALGCVDKGKAVMTLKELYQKLFGDIFTFAVGDGENDLTMLAAVDKPFFVRAPAMIKPVWEEIQRIVESSTR